MEDVDDRDEPMLQRRPEGPMKEEQKTDAEVDEHEGRKNEREGRKKKNESCMAWNCVRAMEETRSPMASMAPRKGRAPTPRCSSDPWIGTSKSSQPRKRTTAFGRSVPPSSRAARSSVTKSLSGIASLFRITGDPQ